LNPSSNNKAVKASPPKAKAKTKSRFTEDKKQTVMYHCDIFYEGKRSKYIPTEADRKEFKAKAVAFIDAYERKRWGEQGV
jgi:hypothetical protein